MTHKQLHYTSEQFNLLLDGRMADANEKAMRNHLAICDDCRSAFESLTHIDAALREAPVIETKPDFTRVLMERILVAPKTSFAFRLLEKMSYVFGLLIVLAVMISAFVLTGVFNETQVKQTKGVASELVNGVGGTVSSSIDAFTRLLVQYLPFAFGKGSMGVAFFVLAVVAMLAAVDRMVAKRVLQK